MALVVIGGNAAGLSHNHGASAASAHIDPENIFLHDWSVLR